MRQNFPVSFECHREGCLEADLEMEFGRKVFIRDQSLKKEGRRSRTVWKKSLQEASFSNMVHMLCLLNKQYIRNTLEALFFCFFVFIF